MTARRCGAGSPAADLAVQRGGVGVEHNAVFGTVTVPRVAVALFARRSLRGARWGDTKLVANAGAGIKAPSVFQQRNALAALVDPSRGLQVPTVGPERGRDLDVGVEQWAIPMRAPAARAISAIIHIPFPARR